MKDTNPSTLTLSGINTYSGGNTITAGTLKMNLDNRTDTTNYIGFGTVSIGASGTLELFNTPTGTDLATGVIGLNATSATAFTGAGTITKSGPGYIDLFSQANLSAFTGTINVNAGTLASNGGNWGTGSMTLNVLSTFDVRTGTVAVNQLTGSGTITTSFSSGNTLIVGAPAMAVPPSAVL